MLIAGPEFLKIPKQFLPCMWPVTLTIHSDMLNIFTACFWENLLHIYRKKNVRHLKLLA